MEVPEERRYRMLLTSDDLGTYHTPNVNEKHRPDEPVVCSNGERTQRMRRRVVWVLQLLAGDASEHHSAGARLTRDESRGMR